MDYGVGLHLYELYGQNATLKRMFAKGKNTYNAQKLRAELERIVEAFQPLAEAATAIPRREIRSVERIENAPEEIAALEKKWRSLYAEMAFLHSKLDSCQRDDERGTMALRILSLDKEINEIIDQLSYYKQHGKLPDPMPDEGKVLESLDRAVLEKMRKNLIANISHAKAGRRSADNLAAMIERKELITHILEK
ncbi:hypothetical protein SAMN05421780_1147 [Flexibacter flexilis DSM 6793]|uniref:Uncharacterized protein n=2 Tax=Flexibacter flexilis TaxID=998 RepID=A0A1I1NCG6_9BACT|nr:hypothetical protein SAMN05421780_1147 [Flexibacter flexilis DSM 6793]